MAEHTGTPDDGHGTLVTFAVMFVVVVGFSAAVAAVAVVTASSAWLPSVISSDSMLCCWCLSRLR